jgi:hypothetical protein
MTTEQIDLRAEIVGRWQRGDSVKKIAADMGLTNKAVYWKLQSAREKGLLPPRERIEETAYDRWRRFYSYRAAPRIGTTSSILRKFPPEALDALLRAGRKEDKTISDTIARILGAWLDDQRT